MEPYPVPASIPAEPATAPEPQDPPHTPASGSSEARTSEVSALATGSMAAGNLAAGSMAADASTTSTSQGVRLPPPPRLISGAWVALLGWLVPGLGQLATGRVGAGLALFVVLGSLFAGGLALTDFSCVDPRTYKLEFVAQALIGGPTALALRLTDGVHLVRLPPWREVGSLYVVVAGFLNLIAICSAASDALRHNVAARARYAAAVLEALKQACARSLAERPACVPASDPALPVSSALLAGDLPSLPTSAAPDAPFPTPPAAFDPGGPT